MAPLAGEANGQANELIGRLNIARLVCYGLSVYLVMELFLLSGVWELGGKSPFMSLSLLIVEFGFLPSEVHRNGEGDAGAQAPVRTVASNTSLI